MRCHGHGTGFLNGVPDRAKLDSAVSGTAHSFTQRYLGPHSA